MPPKTTPSTLTTPVNNDSGLFPPHIDKMTDSYNHAFFVRELNVVLEALKKMEGEVQADGHRRLLIPGMTMQLSDEQSGLRMMIQDATGASPDLFIHFLKKTAKQVLKYDVERIAEVITLFKQNYYFELYPEKTEEIHKLLISLIADLNLLKQEESKKRRLLLSTLASPATSHSQLEEKAVVIATLGEEDLDTFAEETLEGIPAKPEGAVTLPLDQPVRVALMDHFVHELKRKKAEALLSAQEIKKVAERIAAQQQQQFHRNININKPSQSIQLSQSANVTSNIVGALNHTINNEQNHQTADWISSLDDFIATYAITSEELTVIFARLQEKSATIEVELGKQTIQLLHAADYLQTLLPRTIDDAEATQVLTQSFINANIQSYRQHDWMLNLFKAIYSAYLNNPAMGEAALLKLMIKTGQQLQDKARQENASLRIPVELVLLPLVAVWKQYGNKSYAERGNQVPMLDFAQTWMQEMKGDYFTRVGADNDLFSELLALWKYEYVKMWDAVPPMFGLEYNTQNQTAYYHIPVPANLTDIGSQHTYNLMLMHLTPFVNNPAAFISRCAELFGDASLTQEQFEGLRKSFTNKLPPADATRLQAYKHALTHRLRKQDIELSELKLDEVIAATTISGSTPAVFSLEAYDGTGKQQAMISIPAGVINEKSSAEMQYVYRHLLHCIISAGQYQNLDNSHCFTTIPALLSMQDTRHPFRRELQLLMLDDQRDNKFAVANAFFRAIAYCCATNVFQQLLQVNELQGFLATCKNLPYYKLAAWKIPADFYESFDNKTHPFARDYILAYGNQSDLEILLNLHNRTFTDPTHFIRLLGVPNTRRTVIDTAVLHSIQQLQQSVEVRSPEEAALYGALRVLLLNFDYNKADQDALIKALKLIVSIMKRFKETGENRLKGKEIEKIAAAVAADKANDIIQQLETINNSLKKEYPLVQDVHDYMGPKADDMIAFLKKLQERHFLHDFTRPENTTELGKLLQYTGYQTRETQKTLLGILTRQTAIQSTAIDLNKTLNAEGKSWLQVAWENRQVILCHELLLIGAADECAVFKDNKTTFIAAFFNHLTQYPTLLQNSEWRELLIHFFLSKSALTQQLLSTWLVNQAKGENALEAKSDDDFDAVTDFSADVLNASGPLMTFFQGIDTAKMPDIALRLIQSNRFEFVKALSDVYKRSTGREIWLDIQGRMLSTFDTAFKTQLKLNLGADYAKYMGLPGFFTSHHDLIGQYSNAKPALDNSWLELALQAKITEKYAASMGDQYIAAIRLLDMKKASWELKDHTRGLYDLLLQTIKTNKDAMRLNDIVRLINIVCSLGIPALYPIKTVLGEIFAKPAETWHNAITKLNDTEFSFFKISQLDPETVRQQFKDCKPSFNDIIGKPEAIDYFFRIFGNVTRNMTKYPSLAQWKTLSDSEKAAQMQEIMEMYNNTMPGDWNEDNDTKYFTALCLLSTYTLSKTPYHAQFAIIMGTMYAVPANTSRLLEDVATNQGKTFTIAMCIATQAKTWKKYHPSERPTLIPVVTLMDHLARENAAENKPFFDALDISSGDDINADTLVRYTTPERLLMKMAADDRAEALGLAPKADKSEWLIFIDETDVSLNDYRAKFVNVAGYNAKEVNALLRIIWKGVADNRRDDEIRTQVLDSSEFSDLPAFLQDHIAEEFASFLKMAKAVKRDPSIEESKTEDDMPRTGARVTVEKETGIVAENTIGRHGEPQFRQMKMFGAGAQLLDYELSYDCLYYREVFMQFPTVIGFSGTLGSPEERAQYNRDGYLTVNTARFSAQNLVMLPDMLAVTDQAWSDNMAEKIKQYSDNNQPIIIFLRDRAAVKAFYQQHYAGKDMGGKKVNLFLGTETAKQYDRIVLEATEAGTITLSTIIGGRGIDFKLFDELINQNGGMVVGVGTLIDSFNIIAQLLARTARRNNKGMAFNLIPLSEIVEALTANNLPTNGITAANFMAKIDQIRHAVLKSKFRALDEEMKKNYPHTLADDFYHQVSPVMQKPLTALLTSNTTYRNERFGRYLFCYSLAQSGMAAPAIKRYNAEFKREIEAPEVLINVALILDTTYSMGSHLQSAKQKLSELTEAIAKSNPGATLQIAVIAYKDYETNSTEYGAHSNDSAFWLQNNTTAASTCDFTSIDKALAFLQAQSTESGVDNPEAMELALYKANKLNWPVARSNRRIMRLVFVCSDALPHCAGCFDDDFKSATPSGLRYSTEAANLRSIGAEIHMLMCNRDCRSVYDTIAGASGSVTSLSDANTLIQTVTEKVKQSDVVDEALTGLRSMCVSEQISRDLLLARATEVIQATMGVTDTAQAREIAAAKLEGINNKSQTAQLK